MAKESNSVNVEYSGHAVLELLECAENYNAYLHDHLMKCFNPRQKPRSSGNESNNTVRLLDFGAGRGLFARKMRDACHNVECLEPDSGLNKHLTNDHFVSYRYPSEIPDSHYNGIYTLNVLEHIEDDAQVLADFRRKLKIGGLLFVYVPAFQLLYSSFDREIGHFRRYRKQALAKLIEQQGFIIEKSRYTDSLGFIAALTYKLLAGKGMGISKTTLGHYDRILFPVSLRLDKLFSPFFGKNILIIARAK